MNFMEGQREYTPEIRKQVGEKAKRIIDTGEDFLLFYTANGHGGCQGLIQNSNGLLIEVYEIIAEHMRKQAKGEKK